MTDDRGPAAVLSVSWGQPHDEASFVLRGVAAALSRHTEVDVLVPGDAGAVRADGAFEVTSIGRSSTGGWPAPEQVRAFPHRQYRLAVVDGRDLTAAAALGSLAPDSGQVAIVSASSPEEDPRDTQSPGSALAVHWAVGLGGTVERRIGLHVPVHPMARARSHVGLGFTGYLLVLSDRSPDRADESTLTPFAAWLAARFADRHVVVVENAVASVWRWRSLRGLVEINTRADLWRILAHARLTVDLAPGMLIARECVESLRYGVPIVVPRGTAAEHLAREGGGLWFGDPAELLACVERLDGDALRDTFGRQGQAVADQWYGDAARFAERVATQLA